MPAIMTCLSDDQRPARAAASRTQHRPCSFGLHSTTHERLLAELQAFVSVRHERILLQVMRLIHLRLRREATVSEQVAELASKLSR